MISHFGVKVSSPVKSPKGMTRSVTDSRDMSQLHSWIGAMRNEASLYQDEEFDPGTILQNILTAETFDEAVQLQNASLLSGKSITNKVHTIYDFTIRESDSKYTANERSLGVYYVVSAAWEDGTEFSYGVGAPNVLAILWQARQFGMLPGKFQLTGRDTDNGTLLSLIPVKTTVPA